MSVVSVQPLNNQGHYPGKKTFAFTGYKQFQSGWMSPQDRYALVPVEMIMNNGLSGVPFKSHNFDMGENGRYYASHAELQAWHKQPGNPILVTRKMCSSCQEQFQGLANNSKSNIYVGSPKGIHKFTPNGNYRTSLYEGLSEFKGEDANGYNWVMRHEYTTGETKLVTTRSNNEFTESIVYNDKHGTQYYYKPHGVSEYAEYYPNKTTLMLMEDGRTVKTMCRTRVGPSNVVTDDYVDGICNPILLSSRL